MNRRPEFQLIAGSIGPSHAHEHLIGFGGEVNVAGMVVEDGDLVHADEHGAVVIPRALLSEVVEAAAEQEKLEAWIMGEVKAGTPLPGLYPPNAETKARYEAFRNERTKAMK